MRTSAHSGTRWYVIACGLLLAQALVCATDVRILAQSKSWLTVYYPSWAMRPVGTSQYALPPWDIDWRGITHLVHFHVGVDAKTPPYFKAVTSRNDSIDIEFNGIANPGDGRWLRWQDSLITCAHRHKVKVVLSLDAVEPQNLNIVAADSGKAQLLVNSMVGYCERKGYDGVEIDWEGKGIVREDVSRLMRIFRRRLDLRKPAGLLLVSPGSGQNRLYDPSLDALIDQYNLQMYDYAYAWGGFLKRANVTWYISPLHRGDTPFGMEGQAYETRGPLQWIADGHSPSKIGVGIPTFGYIMKNQNKLFQPMKSDGDYGYATYGECLALMKNGGIEGWDSDRLEPFISGVAVRTEGNQWWKASGVRAGQQFFATYENPRSIREKIEWVKNNRLGGVMVYDLTMSWDPAGTWGGKNPLLYAIASDLFGVPTASQ